MNGASDASAPEAAFRQSPTVLDFGEIVLAFTSDGKVIVVQKGMPEHWTLHLGGKSGILDVHVTEEGAGSTHQSLGGLRADDLKAFLEGVFPTPEANLEWLMRRILRRVRFGWLAHRGIYVFPSVLDESALLEFGSRHGRRWRIDRVRLAELFSHPLTRAEVEQSPAAAFSLIKPGDTPGLYGVLFKVSGPEGRFRYLWMRSSRLWSEMQSIWRAYEPEVRARLLTPDEVVAAIGKG